MPLRNAVFADMDRAGSVASAENTVSTGTARRVSISLTGLWKYGMRKDKS